MLRELSGGDILKAEKLREQIPKIKLYERYYFVRVEKLNEMIEVCEYMKNNS